MKRLITHLLFALLVSCLLSCSSRPVPAPVIELYQGKDYRDFPENAFDGKKYTVKQGDTLFAIAWYSGNDYRDLARLNNISKPYSIYPGQQLLLVDKVLDKSIREDNSPGPTKKIKAKQTVDPSKKQAYGESKAEPKKPNKPAKNGTLPTRVTRWVWPAKGAVTNKFSAQEQGNNGIDISGQVGSNVVAAADGKVVYTGNALRGYGQLVIVKHSESFLSAYAHNQKILVKEQQWIKAGQKIAQMGSSGTDKVKLRFEVRYKGKSVDPLRYLPRP